MVGHWWLQARLSVDGRSAVCLTFVSIEDWWHQNKSISDGGEAWLTASDEFKYEEEEEVIV